METLDDFDSASDACDRLRYHLDPTSREENAQTELERLRHPANAIDNLGVYFTQWIQVAQRCFPKLSFEELWKHYRKMFFASIVDDKLREAGSGHTADLTDQRSIRATLTLHSDRLQDTYARAASSRPRVANTTTAASRPHDVLALLGALALGQPSALPGSSSTSPGTPKSQRRTPSGKSHYGPSSSSSSTNGGSSICFCCGNQLAHLAPGHLAQNCTTHLDAFVGDKAEHPRNRERVDRIRLLQLHEPAKITFPDTERGHMLQAARDLKYAGAHTAPIVPTPSPTFRQPPVTVSREVQDAAVRLLRQHVDDHKTHPARRAALINKMSAGLGLAELFDTDSDSDHGEDARPNEEAPLVGFQH
jgi:hypothetical protein